MCQADRTVKLSPSARFPFILFFNVHILFQSDLHSKVIRLKSTFHNSFMARIKNSIGLIPVVTGVNSCIRYAIKEVSVPG